MDTLNLTHVLVTLLVLTPLIIANCPNGCECEDTTVTCKLPSARAVPKLRIPRNTTKLDLSGNNILNVPRDSFKHLPNLEEINLDGNKIYFLEDGAFDNCPNLRVISLEENNLHMIEDNVFSEVESLEKLYLASNSLTELPHLHHNENLTTLCTYGNQIKALPNDAFTNNTKLIELKMKKNLLTEIPRSAFAADVSNFKTLNLVGNRLRTTPSVVREMTGLTELSLCYNPIKIFSAEDFHPLVNLQNLSLAGVELGGFPRDVFVLPELKRLGLKKNKISSNTLGNLNFPKLEYLQLHKNKLDNVPAAFSGVPNLVELDLSNCELTGADILAFEPLTRLKSLNLGDNLLTAVPVLSNANSNIEILKLNKNNITTFHSTNFQNLPNLQTLDLSYNSITNLPSTAFSSQSLRWLDLSHNDLTRIPDALTLSIDALASSTVNLKTLNISFNQISEMHAEDFKGVSRLTTLSIKGNGITTIAGEWVTKLRNLKTLHLCKNKLRQLNKNALANLSLLNELTADDNEIEKIDDDTFQGNKKLTKISLKRNGLISIGDQALVELIRLEEIWLLYNNLTRTPNFRHNTELRVLGLCNNPIGNLPDGAFVGPSKLELVLLRDVGLTHLQPAAFGNVEGISYLNLGLGNNLTSIPTLIRRMRSLKSLILKGNPIPNLHVADLVGLNNLQELRLDDMRLKSCDVTQLFPALPALRTLYLAGNPWECGCGMQWYALGIDGARAKIQTKDRKQIVCASPQRQAGRRIDYLRLGDFKQCLPSVVKTVTATTAVVSLPYIGMLASDNVDAFHAVSYTPLNGGHEKRIKVRNHRREVTLTGLEPQTRYLVCTATVTVTGGSGNTGTSRKGKELCKKFMTSGASANPDEWDDTLLDETVKGGLSDDDLVIMYAVLGAVLGFIILCALGAATIWCRRSRSEMRNQFANISVSEDGGDDLHRGNGRNGDYSNNPPSGEDNKIHTKSDVMMMPTRGKEGLPNMAYDVSGEVPKGVRTKL
nr:slit homolog 1 protein-like [Ciona intestinalis]|eukprot:XP_009859911.2 slit homolog 1 protein-like [Ciona intestinalis]